MTTLCRRPLDLAFRPAALGALPLRPMNTNVGYICVWRCCCNTGKLFVTLASQPTHGILFIEVLRSTQ